MTHLDGYDKVAHLYDQFGSQDTIDFHVANAAPFGEVLDIGAGTGRVAVPIARTGTKVVCVEPSRPMIEELRVKLDKEPALESKITVIHGDAASFKLGRTLPAAFMSGSFDHLLTDEERLRALSNIAEHLEPGGKFVLDVWLGLMEDSPQTWAGEFTLKDTTYRRKVGRKVLPDGAVELKLTFEVFRDGSMVDLIEQRSVAGITDRDTLHRLLARAGFRIEHEFGDYARTPYKSGDSVLILETLKAP
jgi:SAM-dependent methyltransferase